MRVESCSMQYNVACGLGVNTRYSTLGSLRTITVNFLLFLCSIEVKIYECTATSSVHIAYYCSLLLLQNIRYFGVSK